MNNIQYACDLLRRESHDGHGGYTLYYCSKYNKSDDIDCYHCPLSYPHWCVGGVCSKCGYDITPYLDWGEEVPDYCPKCNTKLR